MDGAHSSSMFEAPLAEGTLVSGKYRIEGLIAAGGMGVVYRAWQPLIARMVAIKTVRTELLLQAEATARFWNEARVLAQLETEHVCRVLDGGKLDDGAPYLVLEHLDGADLRTLLNQGGRFSIPRVVDLMSQLLEALSETHAMGIVHRDVKPENLFVTRPRGRGECLKLLDFGICHTKTQARESTDGAESLGSPQYMPPEQISTPSVIDERGDIWAVGVVMYELLTGQVPFDGENLTVICAQVFGREPTSLRELRRDVPPELERAVLRCLAKDPAERFADVAELAAAIAPFGTDAAAVSRRRVELVVGARELDPIEQLRSEPADPTAPLLVAQSVAPAAAARAAARSEEPAPEVVVSPGGLPPCPPSVTTVVSRRRGRALPRALAAFAAGGACVAAVNSQPLSEPALREVARHVVAEAPHRLQAAAHSVSLEVQALFERYEPLLLRAEPANVASHGEE